LYKTLHLFSEAIRLLANSLRFIRLQASDSQQNLQGSSTGTFLSSDVGGVEFASSFGV